MNRLKWVVMVCLFAGVLSVLWFRARRAGWGRHRNAPPEVYVSDIEKYRTSGSAEVLFEEIAGFKVPLDQPRGIAAGPGNEIYLVGDMDLVVLDEEGGEIERLALGAPPACLAVDGASTLYVGMSDHIAVCRVGSTNVLHWASLGNDALLTSVAVNGTDVFAADYGNRVVWRYDKDGRLLATLGRKDTLKGAPGFILPSPNFDLLVSEDRLWVVNPGRTRIEEYTFDGRVLSYWGRPSMQIDGFCGCCNPSHLARLQDGRFVTSEKGLPRVKVYGQGGEFLGLVAGTEGFDEDTVGLDLAVDRHGRILVLDPMRGLVRVFAEKE